MIIHDNALPLILGIVIGLVAGAMLTFFLLRGTQAAALEMVRTQNAAAIEAARSAMLENAAKTGRDERQDIMNVAKDQIGNIVSPIQKSLDDLKKYVADTEVNRASTNSALATSIEQIFRQNQVLNEATNKVSSETRALVGALRSSQTRGRWGEVQLRNVVELAGMNSWCDFTEQTSAATNGEGRPDMTVRIPGGKFVFVDAKVPMAAYLDAHETDDEVRAGLLRKEHAKAVKSHVDELARRGYHTTENSMPYTIMFLPGESLLWTAMTEMPELTEYAMNKGVLLCSPMSLLPLLRMFSLGWREQQQEERAREIAQMGEVLYKRLSKFVGFFNGVGSTLASLNTKYNEAAGSLSARVLPQAQRVHKAAALADEEIAEPVLIDAAPRQLALEIAD